MDGYTTSTFGCVCLCLRLGSNVHRLSGCRYLSLSLCCCCGASACAALRCCLLGIPELARSCLSLSLSFSHSTSASLCLSRTSNTITAESAVTALYRLRRFPLVSLACTSS